MQEMNFLCIGSLMNSVRFFFLSQECKKTALLILLSDAVCSLNRWKQLDFCISVRICSLRVETYKVQLTENLYREIINFVWIQSFKINFP